jgi:carbonic anhydrase
MAASSQDLTANNRQWVADSLARDPAFLEKLGADQHPEYLYIGCSDSRVPANEILGLQPGELFVHRNVGNVVANTDLNVLAVIEYAVRHLHVKRIIVCGHYGCGGVAASTSAQDLGLLNSWLGNIRDVYRLHQAELEAIHEDDLRMRRLVELNVQEQCVNVIKLAVVQHAYVERGYPRVEGWVFDMKTGHLTDLRLDMSEIVGRLQSIYRLTDKDWFS